MIVLPSSPTLRTAIGIAARDRGLYLIAAAFVALSLAWNFAVPVFEAPDESAHLQYILFVADQGRLPDLHTEVRQVGIEGFHPPLYYALLGAMVRGSGMPHPFVAPTRNPAFSFTQMESAPNYFLPVSDAYGYVHLLRFFSTALGLVVIVCAYLAALALGAPRAFGWLTSAVTAFLPQFTFISSVLNNDNLANAFSAIGLVWLLYSLRPPVRLWQMFVLGGLCGLVFLSKYNAAIFLVGCSGLMIVMTQSRNRAQMLKSGVGFAAGVILVAGWYLLYNQLRYGDPGAVRLSTLSVPDNVAPKSLLDPYHLGYLLIYVPYLVLQSFLGVFGWMRIFLPRPFYLFYGGLWLAALWGSAAALFDKRWDVLRRSLVIAPLPLAGALIYANLISNMNQGRFFFPALVAISLVFILGLAELPARLRRPALASAPLFLFTTNVYSLWLVAGTFLQHP